jgi:hypothetical protein
MKRSCWFPFFLFCFLLSSFLKAQTTAFFEGKLIDFKTREAIPFATVKLKDKAIGVISNSDGHFKFPVRYRESGNTIEISCIGYRTKIISIDQLGEEKLNVIVMEQATKELSEVLIKAKKLKELAPYRIVQIAIERVPHNYPRNPYSYSAYYRDYQWKEKNYINLNEALIGVYDSGFQSVDQLATGVRLYEYKKNVDFPRDTTTETPYDNKPASFDKGKNKYIPDAVLAPFGGNELSILRVHDAIRNYQQVSYSFVNQLDKNFVDNHFFTLVGDVYLNKTPLYLITFKSKLSVSGPSHHAAGKIYIQKSNFAIHKLEYAVYAKTMKEVQTMFDIQLEYARTDSLMYLNYISFNNFFKVRNERDYKVISMVYDRRWNAFVIHVNNTPEASSTYNKKNYEFTFDEKSLEIKFIEIAVKQKLIYVYLSDKEKSRFLVSGKDIGEKLKFTGKNLRDVDNRELDKITFSAVHQFRELFVQKLHPSSFTRPDTLFIQRDKPLSQNPIASREGDDTGSWMNSPLKKNKSDQ